MLTWPCWWELGRAGVSTKAADSPARRESDTAARAAAAREVDGMPMGIQLYQGVVEAKVAKCKSEKYVIVSACWVWLGVLV